jgi:hypothetical protein
VRKKRKKKNAFNLAKISGSWNSSPGGWGFTRLGISHEWEFHTPQILVGENRHARISRTDFKLNE